MTEIKSFRVISMESEKFSSPIELTSIIEREFSNSSINWPLIILILSESSNDNEKISLSVREIQGNPFDQLKEKNKGDVVTCNVIEIGDFGVKVRIGDNGPKTIIKKNEF